MSASREGPRWGYNPTMRAPHWPLLLLLSLACGDQGPADDGAQGRSPDPDEDGDLYPASEDCNDTVAAINPGADEICNTIDDNCDGQVDEGVQGTFYEDLDNDQYGNDDQTVMACDRPNGYRNAGGDCDDDDPSIRPGAFEACNAIDDNCDGTIDDGFVCPDAGTWLDGSAYLFIDYAATQTQGAAACAEHGYTLATVDTEAEQDLLSDFPNSADELALARWWIGLSDAEAEGQWTWTDGSSPTLDEWCEREPDNQHDGSCVGSSEEDCVILDARAGGCWVDVPCECAWSGTICEASPPG